MADETDVPGDPAERKSTSQEAGERARAAIGYHYVYPEPYDMSREKIREFARATECTSPVHFDVEAARAAGYADLVAPPMLISVFGIVANRPLFDESVLGYGVTQVMQSEERMVYHNPVIAGQTLTCHVHLDDFRQMRGLDMIITRNEVYDQNDVHLVSFWTHLIGGEAMNSQMGDFTEAAEKVVMFGVT